MADSPLDLLLSRRSVKFVQAPGPNEESLDLILRAAMRAPDHGRLRPWRFKLIRGEAIGRLADLAFAASEAAGRPLTPEKIASTRRWLAQVPLLIAIAAYIDHPQSKIRDEEKLLATGAAVTNMLNAAHMLGFGAFWSTGLGTYVEAVPEALGFDPLETRFMGYLALGTPIDAAANAAERPEPAAYVSEWKGV